MRQFLFGNETLLELLGWHMALLIAFTTGWFIARETYRHHHPDMKS